MIFIGGIYLLIGVVLMLTLGAVSIPVFGIGFIGHTVGAICIRIDNNTLTLIEIRTELKKVSSELRALRNANEVQEELDSEGSLDSDDELSGEEIVDMLKH